MEYDFDLENPFSTSIDNFPLLFNKENDHKPSQSYIQTAKSNPSTRCEILSLILNYCRNFDVFSAYLAINYMDRFLSTTSIPEEKPWILKAVGVSCISLALKMRKTEFSVSDFLDDGVVDPVTIERTEMLILGALKWRMRSVNPFSFISFFILLVGIEDKTSIRALKDRAGENILRAQNDIMLLEFNPSIICAAALLWAADELLPSQFPHFRNSISSCEYVDKVELFNCYEVMQEQEASAVKDPSVVLDANSSSSAPYDVLYLQCATSSSSQDKQISEIRDPKRRKFGSVTHHIEADVI